MMVPMPCGAPLSTDRQLPTSLRCLNPNLSTSQYPGVISPAGPTSPAHPCTRAMAQCQQGAWRRCGESGAFSEKARGVGARGQKVASHECFVSFGVQSLRRPVLVPTPRREPPTGVGKASSLVLEGRDAALPYSAARRNMRMVRRGCR